MKKQRKTPSQIESTNHYLALCLLLILSGMGMAACQDEPSKKQDAKQATLVFAPTNTQATKQQLLQTKSVLLKRLQEAGLHGGSVTLKKREFHVVLPSLSNDKRQAIQTALLRRESKLSFSPVVEESKTLKSIQEYVSKDKEANKQAIVLKKDSWKGPKGEPHTTLTLQHKNKSVLQAYTKKLQALHSELSIRSKQWVMRSIEPGWAAYLIDLEQEMQIRSFLAHKAEIQKDKQVHNIKLHATDGKRFHALTGRHIGNRLVIRNAQKVLAAPVIMAAIRGSAIRLSTQANGNTHPLVALLGAGALPLELKLKMRFN